MKKINNWEIWMLLIFQLKFLSADESWENHVDFIIVGAGTSGSALASRLSENIAWKVLLLEAGGEPLYFSQVPYFSVGPFRGGYDWSFVSEEQTVGFQQYEDKRTYLPFGKGLGGTTLINGLLCTRGNPHDYDQWANMGNDGWSYEDLLPYFKKMENFQVPTVEKNDEYHNTEGPVIISRPPYKTPISDAFLKACHQMGYSQVDYNAAKQIGCANPMFSLHNGTRWSSYDAYLKPVRSRPNLQIITDAYVTQVIFNGSGKVHGVKFDKDGKAWIATAKKEIILSAGTIKTPHILMLSGIGPQEQLKINEISSVINLPGVGQNLQDHATVLGMTFTLYPNVGFSFKRDVTPETLELWETKKQGPLTVPFRSEGIGFFKSHHGSFNEDLPDFELLLLQPPGSSMGLNKEATNAAFHPTNESDTLIVFPILLQPKSTGHLSLQSANPYDHPLIQPNYLSHPNDIQVLIEALKFIQKLMQMEEFASLGVKHLGKILPGCEDHPKNSNSYYECQVRHYTSSLFHHSGTCKMGTADDPFAVVDARLKVHGVKNLRVVDTSIMPTIISGHTMVPAIMIAEKAAAMITEEWSTYHEEL